MTKHTPATPLPWTAFQPQKSQPRVHGNGHLVTVMSQPSPLFGEAKTDAAYIAHAANAYPKLVEALALIERSDTFRDGTNVKELQGIARALLRELGEDA